VKVGRYNSKSVEIIEGLNEGDNIVSSAQFLLDSESSKSSDFKRMHNKVVDSFASTQVEDDNVESTMVNTATVTGTINSLMIEHGMINISRAAIVKWNRAAATVDFITADNVSLLGFTKGDQVEFTFEVRDGNFVIIELSSVSVSDNLSTLSSNGKVATEEAVNGHSNHLSQQE
jgi:Cu(I)/Ag(I) efflux system membrane fusion protein